jgi:purine-binding chemotaxis protein CheW
METQSGFNLSAGREGVGQKRIQYSTFYVAKRLYGIDVTRVQEVVKPMAMTKIPLADKFVHGLINLRGQVVTAVSLHELFALKEKVPAELMNVICKSEGTLVSLLVDVIGDVVEVDELDYETAPNTVPDGVRKFMTRVYKVGPELLSILDVDKIFNTLNG